MSIKRTLLAILGTTVMSLGIPLATAAAATTTVVTPVHTQGWSTADTNGGGTVSFVSDSNAPGGSGALSLVTDATTTSKAQYMHSANVALSSVTELGYYTRQIGATSEGGDASYQLPVYLNGGTSGYTTFVYEPYQNGTVTAGDWQQWNVTNGKFWSTRTVTCSNGTISKGGGGAPFYSLSDIKTACPNAQVIGFGVNVGSNNPAYNVETDLVSFNDTTYDFEVTNAPSDQDACKNDGYKNLTDANGKVFKNQGDCVSFVATKGRNQAQGQSNDTTTTTGQTPDQSQSQTGTAPTIQ